MLEVVLVVLAVIVVLLLGLVVVALEELNNKDVKIKALNAARDNLAEKLHDIDTTCNGLIDKLTAAESQLDCAKRKLAVAEHRLEDIGDALHVPYPGEGPTISWPQAQKAHVAEAKSSK